MKINLRQTGGIAGVEDQFDLDDANLTVSRRGQPPRTRRLTADEHAKVAEAASRLLAHPDLTSAGPEPPVSDSMHTEINIGDAQHPRRFAVESGQDAPDELWDLVDALGDAAKPR